ncbi:PEP/pyruvate-binding domain-containing protein [Streptomyces sp. NPDC059389]|uniref:PEP/pyruvate-binding domain-containing protein n=1 Tax=Streptomyces sp. NPDC059389 TaxID=3346818 RepID=UPI0036C954B9
MTAAGAAEHRRHRRAVCGQACSRGRSGCDHDPFPEAELGVGSWSSCSRWTPATATLETAGGKGAALSELARAGLPVPGGFHVTTAAYREFVTSTGLAGRIRAELTAAPGPDGAPDPGAGAGARIRALFEEGPLPPALERAVSKAYAELGDGARTVAVRSSATAEDLPDLSFAGQQDTTPAADTVAGSPASAGVVEGVARVVATVEEGEVVRPGEILVTTVTNIGWTPLFTRLSAIVTDVGASLSHASIVARELGIPAVVGCGNATTRIRTGDRIRVDGGRGTVDVREPAASTPEPA